MMESERSSKSKKGPSKVIILGLDGMEWRIMAPLAEEGELPNLRRIMTEGAYGDLISTEPPYTPTAWTSMTTGVNPGKHNIFSFTTRPPGTDRKELISSLTVQSPRLWDYLNQAGITTGLLNIPVTFPARPVDGYCVPGFLTPLDLEDFAYPSGLADEIRNNIGDYVINVPIGGIIPTQIEAAVEILDKLKHSTAKRLEAFSFLTTRFRPRFSMVVFNSTDKVQHLFFKCVDREDELYDSPLGRKLRDKVLDIYRQIDGVIGSVMEMTDDETALLLASDHGFGPFRGRALVNRILAREGLLKPRFLPTLVQKVLRRLGMQNKFLLKGRSMVIFMESDKIPSTVSVKETLAYSGDTHEHCIYLTGLVDESTRDSVVQKIRTALLAVEDPATGRPVFTDVKTREELYDGPFSGNAPDLILVPRDYLYQFSGEIPLRRTSHIIPVRNAAGTHHRTGVFAAWGAGVAECGKVDAEAIESITPTVLYLFDQAIPDNMDGKVILDIMEDGLKAGREIRFRKAETVSSTDGVKSVRTMEEEEKIKEAMKGLGYFE